MRVVPAILTDQRAALDSMLQQAASFARFVQVDIMDGRFVPSNSISWSDITGVPASLSWEAHLMVLDPENYLEGFKKAGAQRVVFHYEAGEFRLDTIHLARKLGLGVGMALNPETSWEALLPFVPELDCVLFLTVNPGYYGSKFLPEVLDKVREFKKEVKGLETGVDGGLKLDNIVQVAQTGVDNLCVGSAIFNEPDPREAYLQLLKAISGLG